MKAIEFEGQNIVFAEKQEEYESLPARVDGNGIVTCCMELDQKELVKVVKDAQINITRLIFGASPQPMKLSFTKPDFPVDIRGFRCEADVYVENNMALFNYELSDAALKNLAERGYFWLSTATFKGSLQPIVLSCLGK